LVIDLSDLHFIDGAGLSALVGLIRRARERRSLVAVASDRGGLRNALEHAGLDLIVNLWAQTDDALAEVRSSQI
jgi:anti-anti-sigma factor